MKQDFEKAIGIMNHYYAQMANFFLSPVSLEKDDFIEKCKNDKWHLYKSLEEALKDNTHWAWEEYKGRVG